MNRRHSEKQSELYISQEDVSSFIKVHRTRWIVLVIYVLVVIVSAFQWFQYLAISEVVMKFYNISTEEVDWTAKVFMIVWPVLVLPASFFIDKQGLRVATIIGSFTAAIGAVIKVFSVDTNLFYIVMIGQATSSISHVFLLGLPPKIAATWFPPNEKSLTCSLGVFGILLGRVLGNTLPPIVLKNCEKTEEMSAKLYTLCSGVAAASLLVVFIVFLYYPERPTHAPSKVQLEERICRQNVTISNFSRCLKTLATNRSFLIHTMAYGICLAAYFSTESLMNRFTQNNYFKDVEIYSYGKNWVVALWLVSPMLIGLILDKTRNYKGTAFVVYLLCGLSMGGILLAFQFKVKWMVYITIGFLSLFSNAYMVAGIELAMELTYPSSESTTTGLLITSSQVLGIVFTLFLTTLNSKFGTIWAIGLQVVLLMTGSLLTYWTPNNHARDEALQEDVLFKKEVRTERNIK